MDKIISTLNDFLIPLGFSPGVEREKLADCLWERDSDAYIDLLFMASSPMNSVSLHSGVIHKAIYKMMQGIVPPIYTFLYCTVESRVTDLSEQENVEEEWPETDNPATPGILIHQIESLALPFFEKMHDDRNMELFLEERMIPKYGLAYKKIAFALLLYTQGKKKEARDLMAYFLRDFKSSRKLAESILRNMMPE